MTTQNPQYLDHMTDLSVDRIDFGFCDFRGRRAGAMAVLQTEVATGRFWFHAYATADGAEFGSTRARGGFATIGDRNAAVSAAFGRIRTTAAARVAK